MMTQAVKMKTIHPAFQDLKMFSVMITFMTHNEKYMESSENDKI